MSRHKGISRRAFLRDVSVASLAAATTIELRAWQSGGPGATGAGIRVDPRKLRERIEALSVFGRPAGGTFADGVSRTAYSDADVEGRRYVMAEMKAAGLQPRIDPAGNIFARRAGEV